MIVLNSHTIKPLDEHKIIELANKNQMQVIVLGESPLQGKESISDFVLHHAKAAVIAVKSKNL